MIPDRLLVIMAARRPMRGHMQMIVIPYNSRRAPVRNSLPDAAGSVGLKGDVR